MSAGLERTRCPRCQSNNLPGQDRCWSCGASLPPPEAAAAGAQDSDGVYAPSVPNVRGRTAALIVAGVVIAAALAGATLLAYQHSRSRGIDSERARLEAIKDQLLSDRIAGSGTVPPVSITPEEAQARRELQRLQRQLDQTVPGMGAGDVRLRTGDAMSRDEYDRLRRRARTLR